MSPSSAWARRAQRSPTCAVSTVCAHSSSSARQSRSRQPRACHLDAEIARVIAQCGLDATELLTVSAGMEFVDAAGRATVHVRRLRAGAAARLARGLRVRPAASSTRCCARGLDRFDHVEVRLGRPAPPLHELLRTARRGRRLRRRIECRPRRDRSDPARPRIRPGVARRRPRRRAASRRAVAGDHPAGLRPEPGGDLRPVARHASALGVPPATGRAAGPLGTVGAVGGVTRQQPHCCAPRRTGSMRSSLIAGAADRTVACSSPATPRTRCLRSWARACARASAMQRGWRGASPSSSRHAAVATPWTTTNANAARTSKRSRGSRSKPGS